MLDKNLTEEDKKFITVVGTLKNSCIIKNHDRKKGNQGKKTITKQKDFSKLHDQQKTLDAFPLKLHWPEFLPFTSVHDV